MPGLNQILAIAAIIAVPACLFLFFRPVPALVLRIDHGKVSVRRGKVPGRFVGECQQICTDWKISAGTVKGFRVAGRVSLRFSREIPPEHHQRFRNAWGICS